MAETPDNAPPKDHDHGNDDGDQRVIIRAYPKAVFFYPMAVCALICGILATTGAASLETLGFAFMCIFMFNLVVVAFEFTRYHSVAAILGLLVIVLIGVQLNNKFHVIEALKSLYSALHFEANAGFYFGIFGCYLLTIIGVFFDTRFDYWEMRGNEVLHHHGFLGDVERFPAQSLQIKKEINDVFEYLLLFSGRLILYPRGKDRPIVLENVPRINVLEEMITRKLHTLQVTVKES